VVPAAPSRSRLRLTRRGRVAVTLLAAAVGGLVWLGTAGAAQAASDGVPAAVAHSGLSQVIVQPGQTLWSIAAQADPAADARLVVQQIVTANSLSGESIAAGQHLWVPQG
jgi:Tfp pilus assembly protein FimV